MVIYGKIFAKAHEGQLKCRLNYLGDIDEMILTAGEEGHMAVPVVESYARTATGPEHSADSLEMQQGGHDGDGGLFANRKNAVI